MNAKAILRGRIGSLREFQYKKNRKKFTGVSISLACDDSYKDKNGEKVEQVQWINVVVLNPKIVENTIPHCKVGKMVNVSGPIKNREYTAKDNTVRKQTVVLANEFSF